VSNWPSKKVIFKEKSSKLMIVKNFQNYSHLFYHTSASMKLEDLNVEPLKRGRKADSFRKKIFDSIPISYFIISLLKSGILRKKWKNEIFFT